MFFHDFDFSVQAGGYNSFHEVIASSLPSICYPNLETGRDDQLARSLVAHEAGCMIVLKDRDKKLIRAAIDRIADPRVRELMKENSKILHRPNGASQIAEWILQSL
jgi:UDP-N-acetylglucosamine:LPS N-acetylglucosamine transferase